MKQILLKNIEQIGDLIYENKDKLNDNEYIDMLNELKLFYTSFNKKTENDDVFFIVFHSYQYLYLRIEIQLKLMMINIGNNLFTKLITKLLTFQIQCINIITSILLMTMIFASLIGMFIIATVNLIITLILVINLYVVIRILYLISMIYKIKMITNKIKKYIKNE